MGENVDVRGKTRKCILQSKEDGMEPTVKYELTKAEAKVIALVRALDYGEIRIMIKDKTPIRVEEIRRSIQLTGDK